MHRTHVSTAGSSSDGLSSLGRGLAGALLLAALSMPASAGSTAITTERIMTGLSAPLYVTSPPGDPLNRLFVLEQNTGLIKVYKNGALLGTPFLDVGPDASQGGERGLLGLAFHPDYQSNGRFFVSFTDNAGASVVREYGVASPSDDVAIGGVFTTIFGPLAQPFSNHNGGCIQFGADGKLYLGLGDGGSANDPGNRAQNLSNSLGKMHRIDVDNAPSYVPSDNPYLAPGDGIPDTIWAFGVRNPWRFSFDRQNGDLWMGDVGQNAWEEINYVPASSTGRENYGWRCMEGLHCTGLSGCTCNDPGLTFPVHEYNHSGGSCSVTGGYNYRGSAIPGLANTYFFGDYCSARIWSFSYTGSVTNFQDRTVELAPNVGTIGLVTSFGQDSLGELYIVDGGGEVYKIVQDCTTPVNYCVSNPNSTGFPAVMGWTGTTSVTANNLVLQAINLPPGAIGIFFVGGTQVQSPFGNGFQCVGAPVTRLGATVADGAGVSNRPFDVNGVHPVTAGQTWNFQHWYRNPAGGGAGFNLTDGLSVLFCQ